MFYFRWNFLRVKTSLNVDESCVQNIQCNLKNSSNYIAFELFERKARLTNLVKIKQTGNYIYSLCFVFFLCIYTIYIST
jgi:hypothetical protein